MSHGHSHGPAAPSAPSAPVGSTDQMINLHSYVDADKSQVLNADASTNLKSVLGLNPGILRSDKDIDPELILVVNFRESVKLRGIKFLASENQTSGDADSDASAPATVKIFLSKPHYSFSECDSEEATETITLKAEQAKSGEEVRVKFVKFQNVNSLTIFFKNNQEDTPVTFINKLEFIGSVVGGTNMKDLKPMEHSH